MSGLLIDGVRYDVPGVNVIGPGDEPWAVLDGHDGKPRTEWVRQITIHTTKGIHPQPLRAGKGAGGRAKAVAAFWRGDANHSAAHLVVDNDGSILCLADLAKTQTYHATTVNPWSVGIEMYQEANGGIYEAVLDSTVALVMRLCDLMGIPFQGEARPYTSNGILQRLLHGGEDVVGVFGHRDNAWDFKRNTSTRGRGDPGDAIFARLRASGMMVHHYDRQPLGGDRVFWGDVQRALNRAHGLRLNPDGVCGPATVAALRTHGLWNGGVFREQPIP